MDSQATVKRLQTIVDKVVAELFNVEHLTIKVHRGLGGDWYVEEEWDWKG